MIEIDGEVYYTVAGAAKHLGISRMMFYANVWPYIQAYQFAARRRKLYKGTDLDGFKGVQVIAPKQPGVSEAIEPTKKFA